MSDDTTGDRGSDDFSASGTDGGGSVGGGSDPRRHEMPWPPLGTALGNAVGVASGSLAVGAALT